MGNNKQIVKSRGLKSMDFWKKSQSRGNISQMMNYQTINNRISRVLGLV